MKLKVAAGVLAQSLPTVLARVWDETEGWLFSTRNEQHPVLNGDTIVNRKTYSQSNKAESRILTSQATPALGRERSIRPGINLLLENSKPTSALTSCDPSSNEPDVGILSCGLNRICKPSEASSLGGVCVDAKSPKLLPRARMRSRGPLKNSIRDTKSTTFTSKECDPSSADVGILACGPGEQCVENSDSMLSGFCTGSFFQRRTQVDYDANFDSGGLCQERVCDCSGFDYTSLTGTIECNYGFSFGDFYYGCADVQGQLVYTLYLQSYIPYKSRLCYEVTVPTAESLCLTYTNLSGSRGTCSASFNGDSCGECTTTSDDYDFQFSCVHVGGPTESSIPILPGLGECYVPASGTYCPLCTNGFSYFALFQNTAVEFEGFSDSLTCNQLGEINSNDLISEARCPEAIAIAEASCCASIDDPTLTLYNACYICGKGHGVAYPSSDFQVGNRGSRNCHLADLAGRSAYFNELYCEYISIMASTSCCSAEQSPDVGRRGPNASRALAMSILPGAAAAAAATALLLAWT